MIRKQLSIFQVETLVGRDWRRSRYSPPKQKFLNPNFSMCSPISKKKSLRIHISLHVLMYKSFSICIFSPISTYCILAGWRCTTNESLQWGWAKDFIFDTLLKTLFFKPSSFKVSVPQEWFPECTFWRHTASRVLESQWRSQTGEKCLFVNNKN